MKTKRQKIKIWLGTAAGKISIGLFAASIILILIGIVLTILEGESTPYSVAITLLFGIATNIVSIIVTVTFVQRILDKQDAKKEKNDEIKKIRRFNRVLGSYLHEYNIYYYCVTVPIERRAEGDYNTINTNFEFKDMKDLHNHTMYVRDGFHKSSVELFFEIENQVITYIKRMIEEIDFKYYPDLLRVLCCFIDSAIQANIRNAILFNQKQVGTDNNGNYSNLKDTIHEWIKEDEKYDWVNTVNGQKSSNVMGAYVELFKLLKVEGNLINQYKSLIVEIQRSN